jgi:hypothetical protein
VGQTAACRDDGPAPASIELLATKVVLVELPDACLGTSRLSPDQALRATDWDVALMARNVPRAPRALVLPPGAPTPRPRGLTQQETRSGVP